MAGTELERGGAGAGGVTELKVRMGCGCSGKDGSHGNGEEVTALRDVWGEELTGSSQLDYKGPRKQSSKGCRRVPRPRV